MTDDHDPIDALLRSGGRAYPPAAAPDAAHLRSVVTTSRRRARRARGTVLACTTALVAGGALLTVRPSDEEQTDTAGVPTDDATTQAPTSADATLAGYPARAAESYCEMASTTDGGWADSSKVVFFWIEGAASEDPASLTLSLDGQPFFEGRMGPESYPDLSTGTAPAAEAGAVPQDRLFPPGSPPEEWVVGFVDTENQDSAVMIVGANNEPHTVEVASDLFETIEVSAVPGTLVLVETDGSSTTVPIDEIDDSCDDAAADSTETSLPLEIEPGEPPAESSTDEAAPSTTVEPEIAPTTAPDEPRTTTSIVPATTAPPVSEPTGQQDPDPTEAQDAGTTTSIVNSEQLTD